MNVSLCSTEKQVYVHTLRLWLRIQSAIILDHTKDSPAVGFNQIYSFYLLQSLKTVKLQMKR